MNKRQSLALITILLSLCTTVVCLRRYSDDLSVLENDEDDLFCAVMNPATGTYIDLSQLSSTPNKLKDGGKSRSSDPSKTRWLVSGWGYNTNFTIGVCSSPVTKDEETHLTNTTGAFYQDPKTHQLISIGDFATTPTLLRSKKLTLKYQNGDKCPNGVDRKSTLLNFVCDKELSSKAQITYIGSLHDCSYFFEVRSLYACPTSNKSNEVNLLGIFVGIFAVFFLVEYGGRRWLYGKVRTHFNPVNSQRPTYERIVYYLNGSERAKDGQWELKDRSKRSRLEKEYIEVLSDYEVLEITESGWVLVNLEYDLGKPLSIRDFNEWVYPIEPFTDSTTGIETSMVVSLNADIPMKQSSVEKNHTPAYYTSVERLCYDYTTEELEWLMCTTSDAGGNVPKWIQNATIANTVAKDVPYLFEFLSKK